MKKLPIAFMLVLLLSALQVYAGCTVWGYVFDASNTVVGTGIPVNITFKSVVYQKTTNANGLFLQAFPTQDCANEVTTGVAWNASAEIFGNYTRTYQNGDIEPLLNITMNQSMPDSTPPTMILISPANDSTENLSTNITFTFNVTDNSLINNCSLFVNDSIQGVNTNIIVNQSNNISALLQDGNYYWYVNCTDALGNTGMSETRTLLVNISNHVPSFETNTTDDSNETNPTNIGENVTFTTNATDADNDNYQLVICNSSSIISLGICDDTLICNSSYVSSGTSISCQHNTTGENEWVYNWWSFVCDGQSCSAANNVNSPYNVNHYPYLTADIPNQTFAEDTQISLNLSLYFTDSENQTLTYTNSSVENISITIVGDNVTIIPYGNFSGVRNVTFIATDPSGLSSSSNLVILNVTPVNDAPYLGGVSLNQSIGRIGTSVLVTTTGAGDIDSASYYLQCGNETGVYNLCNGSLGTGERTCDFNSIWNDDGAHTIYCVINDTVDISNEVITTFTSDNTAPGTQVIDNLEGDTTPKYWDTDDDQHTIVQLNLAESNMKCRWNSSDLNYSEMNPANECTVVGTVASCELNVTIQINETTRYVSCQDQYGNDQNITQNTDVVFGVDWSAPSVNDDNDGQIHLPGYNITLTMQDEPLGTTITVYYCNDTTGACTPQEQTIGTNGSQITVTFNERGTWYLRYNATDEAGNINSTKQTIVFINTLPEINQSYYNTTLHTFTVNATVYDAVGSSQGSNYSCYLYHKNASTAYTNVTMELISGTATNGVYAANVSASDGYAVFDVIDTYVNCSDGLEWNVSTTISNAIPNTAPGAPTVRVDPAAPYPDHDLFCNITVNSTDADNDAISYFFEWYKDGVKQNITIQTVDSSNTWIAEVWNCTAIPFDGYENGSVGSDWEIIRNSAPVFNTSRPLQNMSWPEDVVNNSLNLSYHFYDIDGDPLIYNYTPVENITVSINHTTGIVTFTPDPDFYGLRYIKFNTTDTYLWSNYTNEITLNVTSVNDVPLFDLPQNASINEDNVPPQNWVDVWNYSSDVDNNFTELNYSIVSQDNSGLINCIILSDRYVNCSAPGSDEYGINILNITVYDGEYMISDIINMTVISVNDPPIAPNLSDPPENHNTTNTTPFFNMTESTDVDNDTLTYYLEVDDENDFITLVIIQNISVPNWILEVNQSLDDGIYYWRGVVCDNTSATNNCTTSNETRQFIVDTTPPDILITEPDADEMLGWTVPLLSEITDALVGVSYAWFEIRNDSGALIDNGTLYPPDYDYYWDSSGEFGLGGSSVSGIMELLVQQDTKWYNYSIYANDTLGNSRNDSVRFSINQHIPSVNIIYPDEDNISADFNVSIQVQSANLSVSWFNITNSSGYVMYNNYSDSMNTRGLNWTDYINISGWPSGMYNITTFGQDINTSNNRTESTYFLIDVDAPSYSDINRTPDPVYNNDTVYLNVTWYDNNSITLVYISHNASGQWRNYTANNTGSIYYITIPASMLENQYQIGWNSTAQDNFGNWNRSMPMQLFNVSNRAPVVNSSSIVSNITWNEDSNETLDLTLYLYDPDMDNLTYTADSVDNITIYIDNQTGIATIVPDDNFYGIRNITFYANDSLAFTPTNTISLIVENVNDAPNISGLPDVNVDEDTYPPSNWIDLWNYSSDVENTTSQLSYSILSQSNASLINCTIVSNRYLNCSLPASNASGYNDIEIIVQDESLNLTDITRITVNPINDPPILNASNVVPNITMPQGGYNDSINLLNNFFDIEGDDINFSASFAANLTITINNDTGVVNITADPNFYGTRTVVFYATDGTNTTPSNNITIEVLYMNQAPYFDPPLPNMTAYRDTPFTFDVNATDPNNDTMTYYSNSTIFTINSSTGLINFTPNVSHVGIYSINFTVCDNSSDCLTSVILFEVVDAIPVTFYARDSVNNILLDNVTVRGGAYCPSGCTFNYSITVQENPGVVQFNFSKPGFTDNITILNVTTAIEVNITMSDNQSPSVNNVNITPRLSITNDSFYIDVIANVTDNFLIGNVTLNYVFSNGRNDSGTIYLTNSTGDLFNATLGPYNDSTFFMNSTLFVNDTHGNNVTIQNAGIWFMFVAGTVNVTLNQTVCNNTMVLELIEGWNLFSVTDFNNKSLRRILVPLGNGKYGCGHDDSPPYDCDPSDGDYEGNWTMVWGQDDQGNWIYFRPDEYYEDIESQDLQNLYVDEGYWIRMTVAQNITIMDE